MAVDLWLEGRYAYDACFPSLALGVPAAEWVCPLTDGLAEFPHVRLVIQPSEHLLASLLSGSLDCALISVEDAVRVPLARAVPGIGVCSVGPAPRLMLFSRRDRPRPQVVVCDPALFGAALARVAMAEHFGVAPEFVPPDCREAAAADAIVVEGSRCSASIAPFTERVDLSYLWYETTGMPFVHALWTARVRVPLGEVRRVLAMALRRRRTDVDEPLGKRQTGFYYTVGSEEMEGIRVFLRLAGKYGLCAPDAEVVFC